MKTTTMNDASVYFNANWKRYQETVARNTLYHREMLDVLGQFLESHFTGRAFSFVDLGCGDSSSVAPVLAKYSLKKYLGIDAADEVLKLAESNLAVIACEKEFICADMQQALKDLSAPVDIIFTSYAVHHLTCQEKFNFVQNCQQKLATDGFLVMIDGVLRQGQTRHEWLTHLKNRIQLTHAELSPEELELRMQHPRADDFPETIATFLEISKTQNWKSFELLVEKEIFAFMVFAK